jgi:hypothetical protein
MSALLRGEALADLARQPGIRLPPRYLVLRATFVRHQDDEPPGANATMAVQRKVYTSDLAGGLVSLARAASLLRLTMIAGRGSCRGVVSSSWLAGRPRSPSVADGHHDVTCQDRRSMVGTWVTVRPNCVVAVRARRPSVVTSGHRRLPARAA